MIDRETWEDVAIVLGLVLFSTLLACGIIWVLYQVALVDQSVVEKNMNKLMKGEITAIGELYVFTQNGTCIYEVEVDGFITYGRIYCIVDIDNCPERLLISKPVVCYSVLDEIIGGSNASAVR